MMTLFVYSKTGPDGIRKYIHHTSGVIDWTSADDDGGVVARIPGAHYGMTDIFDENIVPILIDTDDEIPDELLLYLSKHKAHGIKKGDTLRTALKKIRATGAVVFWP